MRLPRSNLTNVPSFEGLATMLVGAHAASVYAPERATSDIYLVVARDSFTEVESRLRAEGWTKLTDLGFSGSRLGLFGSAWQREREPEIDIISSDAGWLQEAFFAAPVLNRRNERVMPLPYLVLMKLDSARGVDQGDLTRMLGRVERNVVEEIVAVVLRHYSDDRIAEDVRRYAEIGRWEYGL